jgi:hypothetical protein
LQGIPVWAAPCRPPVRRRQTHRRRAPTPIYDGYISWDGVREGWGPSSRLDISGAVAQWLFWTSFSSVCVGPPSALVLTAPAWSPTVPDNAPKGAATRPSRNKIRNHALRGVAWSACHGSHPDDRWDELGHREPAIASTSACPTKRLAKAARASTTMHHSTTFPAGCLQTVRAGGGVHWQAQAGSIPARVHTKEACTAMQPCRPTHLNPPQLRSSPHDKAPPLCRPPRHLPQLIL